jgi:hypothetical protein
LIDGYWRREALQRLGADRIWIDGWERSVDEALLACLARGPDRAWEAIEEAALIAELSKRHSLQAIAQQLGHDVSWVSRRLSLIKALPEDLLDEVRKGRIERPFSYVENNFLPGVPSPIGRTAMPRPAPGASRRLMPR